VVARLDGDGLATFEARRALENFKIARTLFVAFRPHL
jgi:hypothetical protein